MIIDEIEIGQEVFCTTLRSETPIGNIAGREIGHIGIITSVLPLHDTVFISHLEYDGVEYREFITSYFVDELSIYTAPERVLQNAINNVKNSLDNA